MGSCCLKGSLWDGQAKGQEINIDGHGTYVTGHNKDAAILIVHDIFGWTCPNIRILADTYAEEVNATVFVPDFFGGERLPYEILVRGPQEWGVLDIEGFTKRNSKTTREPEITKFAQGLRKRYTRLAAVGFCFGGWAVFRLGSHENNSLVDCISTAHPTWLTETEIANVNVPVQVVAPEFDPEFTPDLKEFSNRIIPTLGVPYDYQYFPGMKHAFAVRGNRDNRAEFESLVRSTHATASWMKYWLHQPHVCRSKKAMVAGSECKTEAT